MGSRLPVTAALKLGKLSPSDVMVEVYNGPLNSAGEIEAGETSTMIPVGEEQDGRTMYAGEIPCRRSGRRGFTIRVVPRNENFPLDRFETGLVHWWSGNGDQPAITTPSDSENVPAR
jgi:starch phosphorylase